MKIETGTIYMDVPELAGRLPNQVHITLQPARRNEATEKGNENESN